MLKRAGRYFIGIFLFAFFLLPLNTVFADTLTDTNSSSNQTINTTENPAQTTTTTRTATAEAAETPENNQTEEAEEAVSTTNPCTEETAAMSWIICPALSMIGNASDKLYGLISEFLEVDPLTTDQNTPIRLVWEYIRNISNIVFVIFLLIVVISQITGFGLSNYSIKQATPKIIVVAILVNLSFFICAISIDISNIAGAGIKSALDNITNSMLATTPLDFADSASSLSLGTILTVLVGGGVAVGGGAALLFASGGSLGGVFWLVVPIIFTAFLAIVAAFLTLAARQAIILLLAMVSPLAIVAYAFPNTEQLFNKWKALFTQMLVFFPIFSFLFGASALAGYAILASAQNAIGVVLGIAVQTLPLFFSFKLLKMSGTLPGQAGELFRKLTSRGEAATTALAERKRGVSLQAARSLTGINKYNPFAHLNNFIEGQAKKDEMLTESYKNAADHRQKSAIVGRANKKGSALSKAMLNESIEKLRAENNQKSLDTLVNKTITDGGMTSSYMLRAAGNRGTIGANYAFKSANSVVKDISDADQKEAISVIRRNYPDNENLQEYIKFIKGESETFTVKGRNKDGSLYDILTIDDANSDEAVPHILAMNEILLKEQGKINSPDIVTALVSQTGFKGRFNKSRSELFKLLDSEKIDKKLPTLSSSIMRKMSAGEYNDDLGTLYADLFKNFDGLSTQDWNSQGDGALAFHYDLITGKYDAELSQSMTKEEIEAYRKQNIAHLARFEAQSADWLKTNLSAEKIKTHIDFQTKLKQKGNEDIKALFDQKFAEEKINFNNNDKRDDSHIYGHNQQKAQERERAEQEAKDSQDNGDKK